MAETSVSHLNLSVSTVRVFIDTMKFINAYDLWDAAEEALEENGKTELFFDFDVFNLFREMLKEKLENGEISVQDKYTGIVDLIDRH